MATHVQSVWSGDGGSDPASVTITEPTEGNLLVAVVSERGGGSADNHVLSGITGWTHTISQTTEQGDGSHRRSFSMFWKVAEASEGTSLSADDGTTNSKWLTFSEYALEGGSGEDQWVLAGSASNDNGTTEDATSLASGTTAAVSGTRFLEVGAWIGRNASIGTAVGSEAYSNGLAANSSNGDDTNDMFHLVAFDGDDTTAEAKSSTMSDLRSGAFDGENTGLDGGILVFSLVADSGTANPWYAIAQM